MDETLDIIGNPTFSLNKLQEKVTKMRDCRRMLTAMEEEIVEIFRFQSGKEKDPISGKRPNVY